MAAFVTRDRARSIVIPARASRPSPHVGYAAPVIELDFHCDEPEDSLEPRDTGAYCRRCREPIVDLSLLTKKQALAVIRDGARCVQFRPDTTGQPIFRREPSAFAPLGAVALSLMTACGTGEEPQPLSPVAITAAPEVPTPSHAPNPVTAQPTSTVTPTAAEIVAEPPLGQARPPETTASATGVPAEKPALDFSQLPRDPGDCERDTTVAAVPHERHMVRGGIRSTPRDISDSPRLRGSGRRPALILR